MMREIADRLSIVQPIIDYKSEIIEIKLQTHESIVILFRPALSEYIKGTRPNYYWTNSYDVDKYYRYCPNVKCLQNFTELTNLVLTECQKDEENWRLITDLGVKYCDTPGLPSDMKCNCLKETQIESYFNTINRNLREDTND